MAKLQGFCAKGYEPVKAHLEKMLRSGCEDKVQLSVYVGKECVINLFGSYDNDLLYNEDTMQVRICRTFSKK
jgi:hypothetical protein